MARHNRNPENQIDTSASENFSETQGDIPSDLVGAPLNPSLHQLEVTLKNLLDEHNGKLHDTTTHMLYLLLKTFELFLKSMT